MTVEELKDYLQKLVDEGKGSYKVRSASYEYHEPTIEFFDGIDDENKLLWYEE